MKKYVLVCTISNVVFVVLLSFVDVIISRALKIDSCDLAGIFSTICASMVAARSFTNDHGRLPTKAEISYFSWASVGCLWLVSGLVLVIAIKFHRSSVELSNMLIYYNKYGMITIVIAAIAATVFEYFVIRWTFLRYAKERILYLD